MVSPNCLVLRACGPAVWSPLNGVTAPGQPAFAAYQREPDGAFRAYAVTVPTVTTTGIARIVTFFDPGLFGSFGLPAAIPADPAGL